MISTKIHAIIDYLMGVLLVLLPFILDLPPGAPTIVLFALGTTTILYSLFTSYELSVVKLIPLKLHLLIDLVMGIFLATAPGLFKFEDIVSWPFVILGILEVLVALFTSRSVDPAP